MMRRTKLQWHDLIEAQQSSGLPAAEFCRQQGINAKYFSLRKKQLGGVVSEFVKVAPTIALPGRSISSGIKLRVIEVELPLQPSSQSDTIPLLLDRLLR